MAATYRVEAGGGRFPRRYVLDCEEPGEWSTYVLCGWLTFRKRPDLGSPPPWEVIRSKYGRSDTLGYDGTLRGAVLLADALMFETGRVA